MEAERDRDGYLVATLAEAADLHPAPALFSPLTAGLDPHLATMACTLPIGDNNGALLAATRDGTPPGASTLAAVLAHDPFRRPAELLEQLRAAGYRGIANWPSVAPLAGELAAALDHSGFRFEEELAMLRLAGEAGMETAIIVHTREQMTAALDARPGTLVITPGLSSPDAAQREKRAEAVLAMAAEARSASTGIVRIHLHPGFAALQTAPRPEGVGALRHYNRS
ncbi:phosphoenolpyruvate hydrolase family protein [Aquisalimonas asiatica]|uniref:Phosphoenolpyruvate hydrolase-like n=1 Tax=Aquisalimonas asiatica TaxID=406100 RepID=A0A1H8VK61_9GAMM|nr:phosphoenolpyruvate hydrolase family protein [Aquisalimonas asiatica]SEP15759.1 Phosphoenolpyruvate hydrolase-like [Aquisalimonas asiatica]